MFYRDIERGLRLVAEVKRVLMVDRGHTDRRNPEKRSSLATYFTQEVHSLMLGGGWYVGLTTTAHLGETIDSQLMI